MPNFIRNRQWVTRNDQPWELPYDVKPGKVMELFELPGRCLDEGGLYKVSDPHEKIPLFLRNGKQLAEQFYRGQVKLQKVVLEDGSFRWMPEVTIDAIPLDEQDLPDEPAPPPAPKPLEKRVVPKFKKPVKAR